MKFGLMVKVAHVIICEKLVKKVFRSTTSQGIESCHFPLNLAVVITTLLRYRTAQPAILVYSHTILYLDLIEFIN